MKTVSVIIPTYKNRGGLTDSINSVLLQNCPNLVEVIVIDDNDPDSEFRRSTETIMKQYASAPIVKYICHEKNKNGAAARNTGIKASKGNYIAFLDDDDLFLPNKLSKQVEYLENHKEKDAVYCFARRGKKVVSTIAYEGNGIRDILLLQSNYFTPSLMFRREALEAIEGFDESFYRHQDYDLMLRFFDSGFTIGCVTEVLVEIGLNQGENIPNGEKLNQLKFDFFKKFNRYIEREHDLTPGFKNKVYAKHYAGVLLNHIKNRNFRMAINTLCEYLPKSPSTFLGVIWNSLVAHIKRDA